jgi:hypothetical protein
MKNNLKLIIIIIALGFICVENINAQEEPKEILIIDTSEQTKENDNTRISIYFHPVSFIASIYDLCRNSYNAGNMPLFLYKTLEISLDLSNSLIIKPSL